MIIDGDKIACKSEGEGPFSLYWMRVRLSSIRSARIFRRFFNSAAGFELNFIYFFQLVFRYLGFFPEALVAVGLFQFGQL